MENSKIIYASQFAHLDSDVINGGGTDDTEIIQGLLDKALEWGGLHLIMDGAALVRGLDIHSNTTLECMNADCGFYLADGSNRSVIRNSNRSYDELKTRNVTLIGGTYNNNCLHQEHHVIVKNAVSTIMNKDDETADSKEFVVAMEFVGIENLVVRDIVIRDQRTFAFVGGNFRKMYIENVFIELENEIKWGNQDGFHFWGPGQYLTVKNVGGKTEDDFMNIGPDERDGKSSITDVLVDGVMVDGAWQAIRLLSREDGLLDRVTIKNVYGTYTSFGFYINPWMISDKFGNFGTITFENINLRPLHNILENDVTDVPPFLFSIGGNFKSLNFKDIYWNEPYDNRILFRIGYPWHRLSRDFDEKMPHIESLTIDGLQIIDNDNKCDDATFIKLRGIVDRFTLRDSEIIGSKDRKNGAKLIKITPDSQVGRVYLNSVVAENIDCLIDETENSPKNFIADNIHTFDVNTVEKK